MKINLTILTTLILLSAIHSKTDPRTKPKKKAPVVPTQQNATLPPKTETIAMESVQTSQQIPPKESPLSSPPPTQVKIEPPSLENPINPTNEPPATFPESLSKLDAAHNYIMSESISVIARLINVFETFVLPHLDSLKTQNSVSTTIVYFIYTLLLIKIALFFKKKPSNSFDRELISKELSQIITTNFASLKTEMDKSLQPMTLKISEIQKIMERFTAEKKDEEPLDFLVGNLGDLWKEIRDLKTRVNEVDAGGSNLISFNSKMEFKPSGKQDKGLNDEMDDDSASRKFNLLDENNRILPKEGELNRPFSAKDATANRINDNQVMDDIPDVLTPVFPSVQNKKNEADVVLGQPENTRKDFPSKLTGSNSSIPPSNEVVQSSLGQDSAQKNSPPTKKMIPDLEKRETEFGRTSIQLTESDFNKPTDELLENATAYEPKVSLNLARISVPNSVIPKNMKARPPMVRALPPKAPSGNPVPKNLDSNNLI